MTLNTSGPISLGGSTAGQSLNVELGASATSQISFNDVNVRTLTSTATGTSLIMPTDFYGRSWIYSLRFRASASAYLRRTPVNLGSRTTWTWSGWVKRGNLSLATGAYGLFGCAGPGFEDTLRFDSATAGGQLNFYVFTGSYVGQLNTTAVYRDPSAWYHVVAVWDTTNATATDRMRLYVNGVRITEFGTATYPALNATSNINKDIDTDIGWYSPAGSNGFYDGYMAEINFIDGQALTPSSFGATDPATGSWQPKNYTGSYGTNGFYLRFINRTSTATLGNDSSGNNNTWTVNNISLTSGVTYDSMYDAPTNTSATIANYGVLNPLNVDTTVLSNANLTGAVTGSAGGSGYFGTMALPANSKIYAEVFVSATGDGTSLGITSNTAGSIVNARNSAVLYDFGGNKSVLGSSSGYGASYTTNDIIGIAVDTSAGTIEFFKNNTSQGVITDSAISTNTMFFTCIFFSSNSGSTGTHSWNFGQQPYAYTPPTGFLALNTYNLPTPAIGASAATLAGKYFDITLWSGNSASVDFRSLTNSNAMQPDLVWIKSRNSSDWWHVLFDSVRGAGNQLSSNEADAELPSASNIAGQVSEFNTNGFTVEKGSSGILNGQGSVNGTGVTYVGWQWRASNAPAVTNTAGTITSSVSTNTTAGFSIVTYTGTGSGGTVGHGLGATPAMILEKRRNANTNWYVYFPSLNTFFEGLNTTNPGASPSTGQITVNSSTITIVNAADHGANGGTYVDYCFAPIAGYSAFGSYTGNGSADGPFVYLGFRPRWILIKRSDTSADWTILDTARDTYNGMFKILYPDSSGAEDSSSIRLDSVSNGFKIRISSVSSNYNASGGTYIYAAFAESPFKYANAR